MFADKAISNSRLSSASKINTLGTIRAIKFVCCCSFIIRNHYWSVNIVSVLVAGSVADQTELATQGLSLSWKLTLMSYTSKDKMLMQSRFFWFLSSAKLINDIQTEKRDNTPPNLQYFRINTWSKPSLGFPVLQAHTEHILCVTFQFDLSIFSVIPVVQCTQIVLQQLLKVYLSTTRKTKQMN